MSRRRTRSRPPGVPHPKLKACAYGKHMFRYCGGEAPCIHCGWFLQPDGRVTRTVTGRDRFGTRARGAHRKAT